MVGTALIGAGYWGANLARNLAGNQRSSFEAIVDSDLEAAKALAGRFGARPCSSVDEVLNDPTIQAIVVATPAASHGALGLQIVSSGRHVLIEKPFATNLADAQAIVDEAARQGVVAMPGHTFLYSEPVRFLRQLVQGGELGDPLYAYSQRLNLGRIRSDCDAMWNLAPHDLSIFDHLFESPATSVTASGGTFLQPSLADVVFGKLDYASGAVSHFHVSWLDPRKIRSVVVVGSEKMAVYDDVSSDRKVEIYESRAISEVAKDGSEGAFDGAFDHAWQTRPGSIQIPRLTLEEPLSREIDDFVGACLNGNEPVATGLSGLRVASQLEALAASLESDGTTIKIPTDNQYGA